MKPLALKQILELFPLEEKHIKNQLVEITDAVAIDKISQVDQRLRMSWISDSNCSKVNPQNLNLALLVLTRKSYEFLKDSNSNFLVVENPRAAFFKIIRTLFSKGRRENKIENSAYIHPTASVGKDCYIGHGVIIEENCTIGDHCEILHNTCILADTRIGDYVTIGCNNTIGNYGFGYEKNEAGEFVVLDHIGNVVIHNFVEIHNNTCIDRGVIGSTEIFENVKIDNLVHIAHGVVIERNSLIIANAMIAGSSLIGENSWIAPSVSIKNKIKIAANTMTGIGAVVLKDTESDTTYIGNPATSIEDYKLRAAAIKKLK